MSKNFEFANARAAKEKLAGDFAINGQKFEVKMQKDAQIAYLVAAINSTSEPMKIVTKVLNFMERVMTKDSSVRFEALALGDDGGEGLDLAQINEVFQHVLEIVAGGGENPTGSSGASSPPRKRTGARSTGAAAFGA